MVKSKPQNRKTKKQNRKPKAQNRKTKKQNRKIKKQKGGNNDELTMIVRDESLDALKEYVEQGRDINKPGSKGITALMEAIAIQDVPKVQYLIEQGADVNATADDGKTAYSLAFGNDELVDLLENAGANTNPTYLLLLAIEHNNTKSAKAMIDNRKALGLNINKQVPQYKTIPYSIYEYPLTLAIKKDNLEITKHLLEAGASLAIKSDKTYDEYTRITDNKETSIILAVKEENDLMVDLLLDENMNLNRDVYSRFDINQTSDLNFTALYKAVENEDSNIVKKLLEAGANPNSHNGPNKNTPIILAAQMGDFDMIEILFEAGADPLIKNALGEDALRTAYQEEYIVIVNYFSDQDVEGASTLMDQLEQDDEEVVPPPPPAQKTDLKTVVQPIQQAPITIPPFYDVVNLANTDMKTYLDEDPDNIIFIYNQQIAGSDKARIQNEITTNRSKVMLECKDPNTYFHQPKENIVKDEQDNLLYYLNMDIIGLAGVFLPISQLKTLTESSQSRIFFISTLEDKPHKDGGHVITSFGSYDGDDVTSGKHCAENEPIKFGKLHAIYNA